MIDEKRLSVNAIKNGTVIDRIPPSALFQAIAILKLDQSTNKVTFGNNLDSKTVGKKGIIKISDQYFDDKDLGKLAIIAPNAQLNTIHEYKVTEKRVVQTPDTINKIARCFNPRCITNYEAVDTSFTVVNKSPITLKCHYCEKITNKDEIELK